jgi:RNA polymerase sigma-70 factor (ECF subfamily)
MRWPSSSERRNSLLVVSRDTEDEEALIRAAQRGDVASFNQLVLAYQGQVYNVAYRILGDVAAAADATLRYQKRRPSQSLEAEDDDEHSLADVLPSEEEGPERAAERRELRCFIARAALTLPPEQRITFVLSDIHGLSYQEIAQVMNVSLGTVKSRLSRARAKLRDALLAHQELLPDEFRQ